MSLRRPRGESWEKPEKPENLAGEIREQHQLVNIGRFWGCSNCGQVYSHAKTRGDGAVMQAVHIKIVIESITDSREGRSHYDDE